MIEREKLRRAIRRRQRLKELQSLIEQSAKAKTERLRSASELEIGHADPLTEKPE
jgi:hypothetical protein